MNPSSNSTRGTARTIVSYTNIYILIALALDESIILDVLQFPMKTFTSHVI